MIGMEDQSELQASIQCVRTGPENSELDDQWTWYVQGCVAEYQTLGRRICNPVMVKTSRFSCPHHHSAHFLMLEYAVQKGRNSRSLKELAWVGISALESCICTVQFNWSLKKSGKISLHTKEWPCSRYINLSLHDSGWKRTFYLGKQRYSAIHLIPISLLVDLS